MDETPGQCCVILHPETLRRKMRTLEKLAWAEGLFQKKATIITCFSSPLLPSRSLSAAMCVRAGKISLIFLRNISPVWRKKKCLRERERERRVSGVRSREIER